MGLCKCPKRVVTTLFCYEHRVNVCESCLVKNHSSCVIQSYYKWLNDSDYNPNCPLCRADMHTGDCIRLTCYHVFHWFCLKRHFDNYPITTAPVLYQCPFPGCSTKIFPPPMLSSIVADEVRQRLAAVEWDKMANEVGRFTMESDHHPWKLPPSKAEYSNSKQTSVVIDHNFIINERRDIDTTCQQERSSWSDPLLHSVEDENDVKYRRRRRHQTLTRTLDYFRKSTGCKFIFIALFSLFVLSAVTIIVLPFEFEEELPRRIR